MRSLNFVALHHFQRLSETLEVKVRRSYDDLPHATTVGSDERAVASMKALALESPRVWEARIAARRVVEPWDWGAALLVHLEGGCSFDDVTEMVRRAGTDGEVRRAMHGALRLGRAPSDLVEAAQGSFGGDETALRVLMQSAAYHGVTIRDLARFPDFGDDEGRAEWLAAAARLDVEPVRSTIRESFVDASPQVRSAAFEAAAQMGWIGLADHLTELIDSADASAEAVEFSGVVGGEGTAERLRLAASASRFSTAAIRGLGHHGDASALGLIVEWMREGTKAEAAAWSFETITGMSVPRVPVAKGSIDDRSDAHPPIDWPSIHDWWARYGRVFESGSRIRSGRSVVRTFDAHFDHITNGARRDVYFADRVATAGATRSFDLDGWQLTVPFD